MISISAALNSAMDYAVNVGTLGWNSILLCRSKLEQFQPHRKTLRALTTLKRSRITQTKANKTLTAFNLEECIL